MFSVAANRAVSISKNGHTWIIGKVRIRDCYRIKDLKKTPKIKARTSVKAEKLPRGMNMYTCSLFFVQHSKNVSADCGKWLFGNLLD